jgi:hypothetical protein
MSMFRASLDVRPVGQTAPEKVYGFILFPINDRKLLFVPI